MQTCLDYVSGPDATDPGQDHQRAACTVVSESVKCLQSPANQMTKLDVTSCGQQNKMPHGHGVSGN